MKLLPLMLLTLFLFPTAVAEDRIIIPQDSNPHTITYQEQTTSTYTFSLRSPFFNLSEDEGVTGPTDQNLTWKAAIKGQVLEDGQISVDNQYKITVAYNTSHSVSLHVYYTRYRYLGYWDKTFDILIDGEKICTETANEFGSTINAPNPYLLWDFALHGRFSTSPSLYINVGDNTEGLQTCSESGITSSGVEYFSIGGQLTILMQELTGPPALTIEVFDEELYTHEVFYQFATKQSEEQDQENFNAQATSCPIELFGFCLDPLATIKGALSFVGTLIETLLSFIPGGQILYNTGQFLFSFLTEPIFLLLEIFVGNGETAFGSNLYVFFAYLTTWGFIAVAWTGDFHYSWSVPIFFFIYIFKAYYYIGYTLFWLLPQKAWALGREAISLFVQAVRG